MRWLLSAWIAGGMVLGSVLGCEKAPVPTPQASNVSKQTPVSKRVPAPAPSAGPILTEEATPTKPVVAQAALRPAAARNGSPVELIIEVHIAPGWHIYAADGSTGSAIPTSLKWKLPDGVEAAGQWQYPKAARGAEEQAEIYEGNLTFRRPLRITQRAKPGPLELHGELTYQACNAFRCRPPESLALSARGEVVAAP
jgi:DsbC/DsbD-like thiol-disulfide interchange protein